MSRITRVCALSPRKYISDPSFTPEQCLSDVICHWDRHLANAFALKPDLIVLPEACDRPNSFSHEKQLEYYEYRGARMRDHLLGLAVEHHCNIAYSAARRMPDGTYRNSTQFLGRTGKIDGIYNKNHLVPSEYTDSNIQYGKDAPIINTDFGKVGGVICFDIHFEELRNKYEKSRPELLVFSSNHHGGLLQSYWAYSCQSYFIGSIPVDHGCSSILNPVGKLLAESTYRSPYIAYADIDLDYRVLHWDENWGKVLEAQKKYGPDFIICEPDAHLGLLMITYRGDRTTLQEIMEEFCLETWDAYYSRCVEMRRAARYFESDIHI